jgi:hypothetical protein
MGLFDFLFRPPSEAKFAQLMIDELRRCGVEQEITYDEPNRRILIGSAGDGQSVFLGNFYQEYVSLPRKQRAVHLRNRARMLLGGGIEPPDDYEEAREHLRPKLWARAAIVKTRLHIELDGGDPGRFDLPDYEVGSHLIASLVYDLPDQMVSVSREQLEKWGVSYYEALEAARENLGGTEHVVARLGEGFYTVATGDSYDACRLLLPDLIDRFEVQGDLIAMIPNRDSLYIAGSEDIEALTVMLDFTDEALKQPRPMVPIPVRWSDGEWLDWAPPPGHPLEQRFRDFQLRFLAEEYAEQKSLLDAIQERNGVDIFVPTFTVASKGDYKQSFAVWPRDIPSLLPKSDVVALSSDPEGAPILARWHDLQEVAGELLNETEHYPARYKVDGFPSPKQLEELRRRDQIT